MSKTTGENPDPHGGAFICGMAFATVLMLIGAAIDGCKIEQPSSSPEVQKNDPFSEGWNNALMVISDIIREEAERDQQR